LTDGDFTASNFNDADLTGAKIDGANFTATSRKNTIWVDGTRCVDIGCLNAANTSVKPSAKNTGIVPPIIKPIEPTIVEPQVPEAPIAPQWPGQQEVPYVPQAPQAPMAPVAPSDIPSYPAEPRVVSKPARPTKPAQKPQSDDRTKLFEEIKNSKNKLKPVVKDESLKPVRPQESAKDGVLREAMKNLRGQIEAEDDENEVEDFGQPEAKIEQQEWKKPQQPREQNVQKRRPQVSQDEFLAEIQAGRKLRHVEHNKKQEVEQEVPADEEPTDEIWDTD